MGSVGMSTEPEKNIPWEVVLADGSTSTNYDDVMSRWKHDFELLLNYQNHQNIELRDLPELPAEIKKQILALSDILDEFEINRLGKLMFRTVVNSFFPRRTDGRTS